MVKDIQQVNDAYAKVRSLNADAHHVVCAFKILHESYHIYQDFQDDDEHGGGRVLLQALKASKIYNRVVFVTRHYNGDHIGDQRFEAIIAAAKAI